MITFTGARDDALAQGEDGSTKGIEVRAGGALRLYGHRGVAGEGISWTHLAKPAGPKPYQDTTQNIGAPVAGGDDANTLHLAVDVTEGPRRWLDGDWIVVATSSFSPFESEFVQIAGVVAEGTGSRVTLQQPLRHYHFGSADPGLPSAGNFDVGAASNFGVDERAEVGLVSRNVTLTARTDAADGLH